MSIVETLRTIAEEDQLQESWGETVDITEFMTDSSGFFNTNGLGAFTQIYDRADGRFRPVYQNESDLKLIRAMSWLLVEKVPMAQAWVNRLLDYTIGTGFDWTIKLDNVRLQKAVQNYVRETLDLSKWSSELERETYVREIADGEYLGELVYDAGQCLMVSREADELTEPSDKRALEDWLGIDSYVPSWTFGILTKKNMPEKHIGYHFVRSSDGMDWDYVPERNVIFWKRNVRARAKRGFSDFYKPHLYLLRADRVLTNTAEGAATQAAIAYIVEHKEGTQRQANNIVNRFAPLTGKVDPLTGLAQRRRRMLPGTRLDVPEGQQYKAGLLGSNNSDIYVQVMEAALRLAGTVHGFPEGMLTGSYENANLASALVAEGPFMQGRQAEQVQRAERMREMLLKIIRVGAEKGRFRHHGIDSFDMLRDQMTVEVIPARILPRNVLEMTQALQLQKANGWVSDKTAINELGRDIDVETANGLVVKAAEQRPGTDTEGGNVSSADDAQSGNVSRQIEEESSKWQGISRLQWQRNRKAVTDVLTDYLGGKVTRQVASVLLKSIGLASQDIDGLLDDEDPIQAEPSPLTEAERKTLGRPFRTPGGPKKFAVYVKNDKGNTVKVNFGDPNMRIQRDKPGRRKGFRARHNCDDPGPRWKARYWSCRFWSRPSVSKLLKESVGDLMPWDGKTFVREAWLLKVNPRLAEAFCATGKGRGRDNSCSPKKKNVPKIDSAKPSGTIRGIRVEGKGLNLDPISQDEIDSMADTLVRAQTTYADLFNPKVYAKKNGRTVGSNMMTIRGQDYHFFVDKEGRYYEIDKTRSTPEKTFANAVDEDGYRRMMDSVRQNAVELSKMTLEKQYRFDKPSHDFATELKAIGLNPRLVVPSDSNSRYVYVQIPGEEKEFKVRFADHPQPMVMGDNGLEYVGGFDTERGVRHSASDVSIDPETNSTPTEAIRIIKSKMNVKESYTGRQRAMLERWKDYP